MPWAVQLQCSRMDGFGVISWIQLLSLAFAGMVLAHSHYYSWSLHWILESISTTLTLQLIKTCGQHEQHNVKACFPDVRAVQSLQHSADHNLAADCDLDECRHAEERVQRPCLLWTNTPWWPRYVQVVD